jgi:hypothetical protein
MPLTPAHAAAVVPLRQWKAYFWFSPLVVGSMAPDYIYFVFPPNSLRHFGHTPLGLVVFCIPVGLTLLAAFHAFFKRPLVLLMPRGLRNRLWPYCGPYPMLPVGRLAWISVLIYLGAVTHVLWDGLTHEDRWPVSDYPQMQMTLFTIFGHGVHTFGLLQYASSAGGLALLAWWSWRWCCEAPVGRAPADGLLLRICRPAIVTGIVLFAVAVGCYCGLAYVMRLPGPFAIKEFCAAAFITGADAFCLALVLFCLVVNLGEWRGHVARNWGSLS